MTVIGGGRATKAASALVEIEQLKRLIEMQSEIVELAKQNERVENECEALRKELAGGFRRRGPFTRPRRVTAVAAAEKAARQRVLPFLRRWLGQFTKFSIALGFTRGSTKRGA